MSWLSEELRRGKKKVGRTIEKGLKTVARATVPGFSQAESLYRGVVKPLFTSSGKKVPPAQSSIAVQPVVPYEGAHPVLMPVPGAVPVTAPIGDSIITAPASEFAGALRLAFDKGRESVVGQFGG